MRDNLNKTRKKERTKWKRMSVSVPIELHDLLEERAGIAGVSLSRYVFAVLGRKKVIIVPGLDNLLCQLQEIARELNSAKNDPVLLRKLVEKINSTVKFYEYSKIGIRYPILLENESEKYATQYSLKSKNLVEC